MGYSLKEISLQAKEASLTILKEKHLERRALRSILAPTIIETIQSLGLQESFTSASGKSLKVQDISRYLDSFLKSENLLEEPVLLNKTSIIRLFLNDSAEKLDHYRDFSIDPEYIKVLEILIERKIIDKKIEHFKSGEFSFQDDFTSQVAILMDLLRSSNREHYKARYRVEKYGYKATALESPFNDLISGFLETVDEWLKPEELASLEAESKKLLGNTSV